MVLAMQNPLVPLQMFSNGVISPVCIIYWVLQTTLRNNLKLINMLMSMERVLLKYHDAKTVTLGDFILFSCALTTAVHI